MVSRPGCIVLGLVWVTLGAAAAPAHAQSNLDAGKSPAQIFSDTCNACHRSPRELKPTSPSFLREHYTTGAREAAAMAAYVTAVGSDPRAVQQRRPPTPPTKPSRRTPRRLCRRRRPPVGRSRAIRPSRRKAKPARP